MAQLCRPVGVRGRPTHNRFEYDHHRHHDTSQPDEDVEGCRDEKSGRTLRAGRQRVASPSNLRFQNAGRFQVKLRASDQSKRYIRYVAHPA